MIEWARKMLNAAEAAPPGDPREAILTRLGAVLLASHAVYVDSETIPSADRRGEPFWWPIPSPEETK